MTTLSSRAKSMYRVRMSSDFATACFDSTSLRSHGLKHDSRGTTQLVKQGCSATKLQAQDGISRRNHFHNCRAGDLREIARFCRDELFFDYLRGHHQRRQLRRRPALDDGLSLYALTHGCHLRLKLRSARKNANCRTVSDIWPTANWHEREIYDMMGIRFRGHPDLRRILMWEGYPYFPLRKGFPAGRQTERNARRGVHQTRAARRRTIRHSSDHCRLQRSRTPRPPAGIVGRLFGSLFSRSRTPHKCSPAHRRARPPLTRPLRR